MRTAVDPYVGILVDDEDADADDDDDDKSKCHWNEVGRTVLTRKAQDGRTSSEDKSRRSAARDMLSLWIRNE
jgi:hypothetical protein